MNFIIAIFIVLSIAVQCQAEVVLKKGSNETVTFDGDEVEITVHNPHASDTYVVFCFASAANAHSEACPKGYLQHNVISEESQILKRKVNRQGQLFVGSTL
uniref:Uncharacterized protein n=1 Tax=Panagrellus redivivus TaxID=6233 RepID=A0A7E4US99_PANRE